MLHETSKLDGLPFINFQENNQLKLPKYISTHIMLFHSIKQYSLKQLFLLKAWFPYDRCDRCNHWEKKSSVIAAIIWKPLSSNRSDNDRWDRKNSISAIVVAAITTIIFYLIKMHNSRLVSIWSLWLLRSLNFFFSAIVAIIWKPALSYGCLLNKICFITLSKQEGCIMLFSYSCFNCCNKKGLLNFVSEKIKLVYRINNTWYLLPKK